MAENQLGGQQYLILPEGASRLIGKEAQRTNIAVGYAVSSIVRTTLGPKGMDKMLVSELGDIIITNDGAAFLLLELNEVSVYCYFVSISYGYLFYCLQC